MATTTLAKDGYIWKRGMTSNVGAWTLIDPDGVMVAHVYRGNDRTWCAVDGEGTVVAEHADTCSEALRAADTAMRPCAWIDMDPRRGIVGCDRDRWGGTTFCAVHAFHAAVLDGRDASQIICMHTDHVVDPGALGGDR